MQTILVVDDEQNIRELAKLYLEKDGFKVVEAEDGAQALNMVDASPPDLVVLDVMLPQIDGIEVCRRIRSESDLPILMLTARDEDIDQIIGLEMGADDYMTKPFNPRLLVSRVKAILRRTGGGLGDGDESVRRIGNLALDPAGRTVYVDESRIELRAKEFDLLFTLIEHKNRVLSRDQLLDLVWGYDYAGQTRTVDVHVAHLRDKLEAATIRIETVWGKGYKLEV